MEAGMRAGMGACFGAGMEACFNDGFDDMKAEYRADY